MKCVVCKKDKERNIDNYVASHVVNKDIEGWFNHYKAGCESLKNAIKNPCKDCKSKMTAESRTNDSNEFLRGLGIKRGINLENVLDLWSKLEHTYITCIPKKYLVPSMNHVLAPSLYKLGDIHIFDLAAIHSQNKVDFKDLKQVFLDLYKHEIEHEYNNQIRSDKKYCDEIKEWYAKKPSDYGLSKKDPEYAKKCLHLHLPKILYNMVNNH